MDFLLKCGSPGEAQTVFRLLSDLKVASD